MQKQYWKALCSQGRIEAISEITAIAVSYATVLNFQKFSDMGFSMVLEVQQTVLSGLYTSLGKMLQIEEFKD